MRSKVKQCGIGIIISIALWAGTASSAAADKAAELRRDQLAKVKRIAVLPLFFGSDTLRDKKATPESKPVAKPDTKDKSEAPINLEEFRAHLRKMEARANERLPERVAQRTPYTVISEKEEQEALKAADLKPFDLFQNAGVMKGTKFAAPDPEAVKKLAKSLKADALLIGTMEEPRRNNGGIGVFTATSPHVSSRIIYYVLLPDGADVFHYTMDVVRPLSRIGAKDYVLADWLETVDHNIESFLDELSRYTPAK